MESPSLLPVLVATAAIFIAGWLWYSPLLFLKPWLRLRGMDPSAPMPGTMPFGKMAIELVRCFILSYMVAHLITNMELHHLKSAVHAGLFYWAAFPVMFLVGPVNWENMSWKLAAIHAGDWLVKLLLIPIIVVVMQ
jgi:hypothetical protein